MEGTYIEIPKDIKDRMKSIAKKQGLNFKITAKIAFEEYLKKNEKKYKKCV